MARKKSQSLPEKLNYSTQAEPRAVTADGVPVFCSHDELISIEKAVPNPRNPNRHSERQVALLGNIIEANGWRQPITISRQSGFVVKGHGRLMAARRKGWTQIPVEYQQYASEAEEWADLIADNRIAELAEIDDDLLASLLAEIDGVPLELTGFDDGEIDMLLARADSAPLADLADTEDDIDLEAALAAEPRIVRGEVWRIGRHLLMCGDSTNAADVAKLMDGAGHLWCNDHSQTTVLEYDKPQHNDIHPTMKPVPLFEYQIRNSSLPGAAVLDLFSGSGTTGAACERSGRTAYLMECDPHYAEAAIARLEKLTGAAAIKIG